jgi:hypothetical protein
MYRTRAVAGIGSASPTPDLREPARAAPRMRKYRRAERLGLSPASAAVGIGGRHEVRQQQPQVLLEDTGLQSRPTTDGSIEVPTTDAHVCANGPATFLMSSRLQAPGPPAQQPLACPVQPPLRRGDVGLACHRHLLSAAYASLSPSRLRRHAVASWELPGPPVWCSLCYSYMHQSCCHGELIVS